MTMLEEAIRRYDDLLAHSVLSEAACVAIADATTPDDAIRAYGGDPATAELVTGQQAARSWTDGAFVLAADVAGATIVIEINGYQGTRAEVLRPLSAGGRAAAVFWNVDANSEWVYAVAGERKVHFEMLGPLFFQGAEPDLLATEIAAVPFDSEESNFRACGLALAEQVIGTGLPTDWEALQWRRATIRGVPEDLVPDFARDVVIDQELQAIVDDPSRHRIGVITRRLVDVVVDGTGIAGHREVREARDIIAGGSAPDEGLRDRIRSLADESYARWRSTDDPEASWPHHRTAVALTTIADAVARPPAARASSIAGSGGMLGLAPAAYQELYILGRCASRASWDRHQAEGTHS